MASPQKLWLSVDLSALVGSFALHRLEGTTPILLSELITEPAINHTETAMERLQELLKLAGVTLDGVDRFLTPIGPGSFTGLRLALATVKAFAFALSRPITTMNAGECRWLASRTNGTGAALTFSTTEKIVVARFDAEGRPGFETVATYGTLEAEPPKKILLDDRIDPKKLPLAWQANASLFPLRARHLAETAGHATSRRDHVCAAEWIRLSPEYLGTSIKPIFGGG